MLWNIITETWKPVRLSSASFYAQQNQGMFILSLFLTLSPFSDLKPSLQSANSSCILLPGFSSTQTCFLLHFSFFYPKKLFSIFLFIQHCRLLSLFQFVYHFLEVALKTPDRSPEKDQCGGIRRYCSARMERVWF